MKVNKIDIDKLVSSLMLKVPRSTEVALNEQGFEYKDGKLQPKRKYKDGDWVVYQAQPYQVRISEEGTPYLQGQMYQTYYIEELCRPWTIKDANAGDVLHKVGFYGDCVFIFNAIDDGKATAYCCIDVSKDKIEFGVQGPDSIEVEGITPATYEQKELLFKTIVDSGYHWDSETKRLTKLLDNSSYKKGYYDAIDKTLEWLKYRCDEEDINSYKEYMEE